MQTQEVPLSRFAAVDTRSPDDARAERGADTPVLKLVGNLDCHLRGRLRPGVADIARDPGDRSVALVDRCEGLVLDLSRNRSRRYCSTACANRNAVAAYRARGRRSAHERT